MCSLLGGRVAEEILNGEPSTGALNDLERMTGMAYSMVQYYGMSEKVGNLSFYDSTGARGYNLTKPYSEKTAELMDEEVKALVQEVHDRTYRLIEDHKEGFMQMGSVTSRKRSYLCRGYRADPRSQGKTRGRGSARTNCREFRRE
jgi:ATP-dependent Zn proteases